MKVRIIADSTVDMAQELKERISLVPLNVHFGEEQYIDGVTIDNKAFYEKLARCDTLPTTSLASPGAFMDEYEKISKTDESAVVITVASKLSGTYQSAVLASADYDNIYVVDGGNVAIGTGILVELALKLADEGKSAEEIVNILEEEKKKVVLIALVDTLEYLKRGGRVSKTVAVAGDLLGVKPVVALVEGKIDLIGVARGSKKANKKLVDETEDIGGVDFSKPVLFGYTGLCDESVSKYVDYCKNIWEGKIDNATYVSVGSVIGTQVGPGAMAIAFFKN